MPSLSRLSIVLNTYEWPEALDVVLRAFAEQTDQDFEIVVGEDGSSSRTGDVVESWSATFDGRLRHVWHEDAGYRRARVVDLAALQTGGECLVFIDGDCVPRVGFVAAVRRAALPGWFLSTKRVKLNEPFTERVLAGELPIWRWSAATWMIRGRSEVSRPGFFLALRDRRRTWRPDRPDFVPPDNGYGFFCAMSRADFYRVNGWDTRFVGWGNDDVDLAVRLRRLGLRCGWPGPDATLVHLWHAERRDSDDPAFLANERLLHETLASDRVEALEGVRELSSQLTANRVGASRSSRDPVKR